MIINSRPTKVHTAFNANRVELQMDNWEQSNSWQIRLHLELALPNQDYALILTKDALTYPGNEHVSTIKKVSFDLAPVLTKYFEPYIAKLTNRCFTDNQFFVKYRIIDPEVSEYFYAINAVVQIGYSPDLTYLTNTFLTSFKKLRKYTGYPLDVAAMGSGQDKITEIFINGISEMNQYDIFHFLTEISDNDNYISFIESGAYAYLLTNDRVNITTNFNVPIIVQNKNGSDIETGLEIIHECLPTNPFYIRWINRQGGRDYWMFSTHQEILRIVSSVVSFQPFLADVYAARETDVQINADAEERITVYANQIPLDDFNVIKYIPYSPKIEYYNTKIGQWMRILPAEKEVTEMTGDVLKDVEFEFILPKPQIQF